MVTKIIVVSAIFVAGTFLRLDGQSRNVLVLTERHGQHESFTARSLDILYEMSLDGSFVYTEINNTSSITKEFLSDVDLIIQLDFPPYTWSDESKAAFEEYIDKGSGGWIGFHHATLLGNFDGWPMWEWFSNFMGGIKFKNYIAETASGLVRIEDLGHPVTQGVEPEFILLDDEWYTFDRSPRPNVKVLANVDESSYAPPSEIKMGDHPVIWVNESKKARNVYFLMGHGRPLYDSDNFITMFQNAIWWTLKMD